MNRIMFEPTVIYVSQSEREMDQWREEFGFPPQDRIPVVTAIVNYPIPPGIEPRVMRKVDSFRDPEGDLHVSPLLVGYLWTRRLIWLSPTGNALRLGEATPIPIVPLSQIVAEVADFLCHDDVDRLVRVGYSLDVARQMVAAVTPNVIGGNPA